MHTSILTRMEEDLQLFGFSERTKETYLYRAKKIIEYFNPTWLQILFSYSSQLGNVGLWAKKGQNNRGRQCSGVRLCVVE